MRRKFFCVLCAVMVAVGLCGCAASRDSGGEGPGKQEEGAVYSNLLDEDSQNEVYGRLESAGVAREVIEKLDVLVEQYNRRMTVFDESDLEYMQSAGDFFDYREGFSKTFVDFVRYGSNYNYMKKWLACGEEDDILCRTLAYLLLQNKIGVERALAPSEWACANEDAYLFSDREVFEGNAPVTFDAEQMAAYFTLFAPVNVRDAPSEEERAQALRKQWEERGVRFSQGSLSLISVWSEHDGILHNSHAGVLIDDQQGLLFFEKTNPFFPYQATKFGSRAELRRYMLAKLAADFEQEGEPAPSMVVMENGERL